MKHPHDEAQGPILVQPWIESIGTTFRHPHVDALGPNIAQFPFARLGAEKAQTHTGPSGPFFGQMRIDSNGPIFVQPHLEATGQTIDQAHSESCGPISAHVGFVLTGTARVCVTRIGHRQTAHSHNRRTSCRTGQDARMRQVMWLHYWAVGATL